MTKDIKLGNAIKVNVSTSISKEDDTTDKSAASYDNTKTLDNLPTVKAVKTYVEDVKSDITDEYEAHVDAVVKSLDSTLEVNAFDAASTAQNVATNTFFTKIAITDGKLDTNLSESRELKITDITDFRSLTETEIYTICGATKPEVAE